MALKQLLIGKRISEARAQLDKLMQMRDGLIARRADMKRREEELEASVSEMTEETSAEDREAFDALTQEWESEDAALAQEEAQNEQERQDIEAQIEGLENELAALNARSQAPANTNRQTGGDQRKDETTMNTRKFYGMTHQERSEFFAREDVKSFLGEVRSILRGEKRTATGTENLIPTVVLDLIRERVEAYSKLLKHVNLQRVSGKARQTIMGVVPEAVWTEQCGKLNELNLSFGAVELDGYKVGAFIAVCNAVLEDNDVDLATKMIEAIGKAMGIAVDKAILYGTGNKMPTGIVTALTAGEHADTNVIAISDKTGIELYQAIVEAAGEADSDYTTDGMFWAMNNKTKTKLMSNAMGFNAAGAIVTGQHNEMPVIGGAIETLGFIPDDVIIGGYGELYTMAERAGMAFAKSEHAHFVEDETLFKGTARYDGKPVIEKGFVAIGIGGKKPTAGDVTFAADTANAT